MNALVASLISIRTQHSVELSANPKYSPEGYRLSGVVGQKVRGAKSWNFPTDSWKFRTEDIMGAQNSNFVPDFTPNWVFFAPNFVFLDENFRTQNFFLQQTKI